MRSFITFVSFIFTLICTVNAQTTTLAGYVQNGQAWDITYNTNVDSFADLESGGVNFSLLSFWGVEETAKTFANGTHASKPAGLRFAFTESSFSGSPTVLYHDSTTNLGNAGQEFQTAESYYAVSAVRVPAPLPILGILPVVGFLKRMRKRQRA